MAALDVEIEKVRTLTREGKSDAAMSLCQELVAQHPSNANVWRMRAHLYFSDGQLDKAEGDITHALSIDQQSVFFFTRARYRLRMEEFTGVAEDIESALLAEKMNEYGDETYLWELYFFRAEAWIKLGQKNKALVDLNNVPDDFRTWTFALRTKADLLADCQ